MEKPKKQQIEHNGYSDPISFGYCKACDDWQSWITEQLERIMAVQPAAGKQLSTALLLEISALINELKERV